MARNLTGATLAELLSELGRRRAGMRESFAGGTAPTCKCGKCRKCKVRTNMRKFREKQKAAGE